jgi:hypothetical protein
MLMTRNIGPGVCLMMIAASLACLIPLCRTATAQHPVPVTLKQDADGGWQLLRDGQPWYINGAGGAGSLADLVAAGGNTVRTWGVDDVEQSRDHLDQAHQHGLGVVFGIWLEHERKGFSYNDYDAVVQQIDLTMQHVREFKNHPALVVWGIGNEMEGVAGDDPAIWLHIEHLARLIKQEDPLHPVMTVVAEIGGRKVEALHKLCPSVDIIGINSYGGTTSLPARYREAGGTKPYLVTEFGPRGPWESGQDSIGAVPELTSTAKAELYRQSYTALRADDQLCLGSSAFLWGHKQEATATWFGMYLADGRKTQAVDTMTELWSGRPVENRCPQISELVLQGPVEVTAGTPVSARLTASDPEGQPLEVDWVLMADASSMVTWGDFQETPTAFPELIEESTATSLRCRAPSRPGIYRIYGYVGDGDGGAAVANVPFRVRDVLQAPQEESEEGARTELPLVVFDEPETSTAFAPSGWMGRTDAIAMDDQCQENPHDGKYCVKFTFSRADDWGGVVWQNPPDDWGDLPGGYDLSGANKLTFWARGENGGEKIKFGFGLLGRDKKHFDSGKKETAEITLTREWKQYSLDLTNVNLSRIKTGFYWTLAGQGKSVTFYLDRIIFEPGEQEE